MAIATVLQPMNSFPNILYNASFCVTHPVTGATVVTLAVWYASTTDLYFNFRTGLTGTATATPTVTSAAGVPVYTFTVPGSSPPNEQYAIAVDGFIAAASSLGFAGATYPVAAFVSHRLAPGNTYIVSVGILQAS